jgi:hypothetical protein
MFNLTAQELDNAFAAISHHGYSTMLPEPSEWHVVSDNWPSIRTAVESLDLDTYNPFKPLRVFAPKSRANVRVTHILHPQDLIIYTALVLIAKNDIERRRVTLRARRVFSYRADPSNPEVLYGSKGSYAAYRNQLAKKAARAHVKYVAVADIADFYPRIYQHRLENIIQSVGTSDRVREVARVLVRKLVAKLMDGNSYGIPVGPYASRLLGEAVTIDVDAFLESRKIDFVRWVDDYNMFCKSEYDAQSILFSLGVWMFTQHGLTLQVEKTKIIPVKRYQTDVLSEHEDQLSDRDEAVRVLKEFATDYDADEDKEPDPDLVAQALAKLQAIDLMKLLRRSLRNTALVDYEAVTYALTRLPRIPGELVSLKRQVLDLVIENAALLYPVAEHIAKYVLTFDDLSGSERRQVARKLLRPLSSRKHRPPDYYAMWILHVFASTPDWNHSREIIALYRDANNEVVKRFAALAIHTGGTRAEALAMKDDYAAASPLLRLALLFLIRSLGVYFCAYCKVSNAL